MNNGLTKFGGDCPHLVTHTYTHPRNEVEVLWTAPATGAGCIEFRFVAPWPVTILHMSLFKDTDFAYL